MLPTKEIAATARRCLDAWEAGRVDDLLAHYTEDVVYSDTRTKGKIQGKPALRRYLGKLLGRYDLKFFLVEGHRIEGHDGESMLWECVYRRRLPGGGLSNTIVQQRGISLCMVDGDQVKRHEAFIDLSVLDKLENAQ
ncbi:MAG: nuclear transport factor 2 family protein [Burkholderiales bacterium]